MNATELVKRYTVYTGEGQANAVLRLTTLRAARLMRGGGGRGPYAEDVSAEDAANYLIAALGGANARDGAVKAVQQYANLTPQEGVQFPQAADFGEALTILLQNADLVAKVVKVIVNRSVPEARIVWRAEEDGPERVCVFREGSDAEPRALRLEAVLEGWVMVQIRADLNRDT